MRANTAKFIPTPEKLTKNSLPLQYESAETTVVYHHIELQR